MTESIREYPDSIAVEPGDYVVVCNMAGEWEVVRALGLDNGDVRCDSDFAMPNRGALTDSDGDYYGHLDPVVFMSDVLTATKDLAEAMTIADTIEKARVLYLDETKPAREKLQSKLLLLKC